MCFTAHINSKQQCLLCDELCNPFNLLFINIKVSDCFNYYVNAKNFNAGVFYVVHASVDMSNDLVKYFGNKTQQKSLCSQ